MDRLDGMSVMIYTVRLLEYLDNFTPMRSIQKVAQMNSGFEVKKAERNMME
jgi:hypothetical protein